jgi:hypothetical protein
MIIAKQRNGPVLNFLTFLKEFPGSTELATLQSRKAF